MFFVFRKAYDMSVSKTLDVPEATNTSETYVNKSKKAFNLLK